MDYTWLFFALLSAVTAALVAIFGKVGLAGIDANLATAVRAVIMAVFLVGVVAVQGNWGQLGTITTNGKAMAFIVLGGIAGALSWLFYFMALKAGRVSQVAPIDRLSVVFAVAMAVLFLGDRLDLKTGVGVALMAAGAIVIALG